MPIVTLSRAWAELAANASNAKAVHSFANSRENLQQFQTLQTHAHVMHGTFAKGKAKGALSAKAAIIAQLRLATGHRLPMFRGAIFTGADEYSWRKRFQHRLTRPSSFSTARIMSPTGRWRPCCSSALKMGRPLFLEGEAGVGKTEIAKVLAKALDRPLIRLQCYEGLDVSSAVYEWNYAAQMIEIRMAEATGETERDEAAQGRLLRQLPDPPPGARGAVGRAGRRAGLPDRRTRPHRRGVRGVPAGGPVRLPGDDPRTRHDQGRGTADRHHHHQPHARDPRRAEAPLPLPLGRLSRRGARTGDRLAQGAAAPTSACRRKSSALSRSCARWSCSRFPASPRPSTGRPR